VRRLLPLILTAGVVAGACSAVELADFMDAYGGGTELSDPGNDADVQAAGESAAAADQERQVSALIDEALEQHDVGKIRQAEQIRPYDPRLPFFETADAIARDEPPGDDTWDRAIALVKAQYPDVSTLELEPERRAGEMLLDAVYRTLLSYEYGTEERARLADAYCRFLDFYWGQHSSSPAAQTYYLLFANPTLCD
jgi:hypothetical protein